MALINRLNKPLSKSTLDKISHLGIIPNLDDEIEIVHNKNTKLNPDWISGFITGEGSFTYFRKTRKNSKGDIVKDYTLAMEVSQDSKDWFILNSIKEFFEVGKVYTERRGITKFRMTQKDEIISKLIPYFNNCPLQGHKAVQYSIWIEIVKILATEQVRTPARDSKVESLIKELSEL